MPANDNVTVRIVGDASGVPPAIDLTEQSLAGLAPMLADLNANIKVLTANMREGFASVVGSVETLQGSMAKAKIATEEETGALARMIAAGKASSASLQSSYTGLLGTFAKLSGAFVAFSALLAGGAAFKFAIDATTKWTQDNLKLSQSLGITLERASGLHLALNKLGIETDTVTGASQRLVRQLKIHENAVNDLGIATRDSNGHFRDTLDILVDGMGRLNDYQAGVDRTAAAQRLFGRGAGDLTNMLRLTNEQIEEGTRVAHELGLVTTEEGVQAMRKYKDATNEAKDIIEAFKIDLGNALLPVLTDVANWMRGHGRQAVETWVSAIGDAISAIKTIILDVKLVGAQFQLWGAQLDLLSEKISTFCNTISEEWSLLSKVMGDFPDWSKMKSDWESGMAAIDKSATDHINHIIAQVDAARLQVNLLNNAMKDMTLSDPGSKLPVSSNPFDFSGLGKPPPPPSTDLQSGDRLDNLKTGNEKKPKDDLVQQLDDQLTAKKAAWEKEQIAQGTAQEFSLESERDFWAKALQLTDLSAKDRAAIETKWIAASQAIQKEEIAKKLDGYKADIEAAGNNSAAKLKILRTEAAFVHRMFGDKSKEAAAADAEVVRAEQQAAAQLRQLWDGYYKHEADIKLLDVDMAEAAAQQQVDMGLKTKGQLLAQEKQFENQRFEIRRQELQREKALIDPNRDPIAYQKASQAIETLERQHQQKLTQIDQQAVLQRTQIERNGINQFASSWASALAKMATLQASFSATLKSLWQGIQQAIASVIEQMLEQFIAAELTKLIYGKTTGQATIATEAAKAGAAGVASWAGAPWPIDAGAPAFGASMSAAAMAFSGLNSAEGGWWDVQPGLSMLHAREMVLPAWAAEPLRNMIKGSGPANFNAPPSANDHASGDTHLHLHGAIIQNPRQLKRWFEDNRHAVGSGVRAFVRQGGNTSPNR